MMSEHVTLVTGVIGTDPHIIGNRILSYALQEAGFNVVSLGAYTPAEEFIKAAIETNASAILVGSFTGQGELECEGFGDKCREAGLDGVTLYIGGNIVIGQQDWKDVVQRFTAMGFDRVYPPGTRPKEIIQDLRRDLGPVDEVMGEGDRGELVEGEKIG